MCDTLAVTTLLLCACEKDGQHSLESKKNLSARLDSGIYTVYCEPKSVVVVVQKDTVVQFHATIMVAHSSCS